MKIWARSGLRASFRQILKDFLRRRMPQTFGLLEVVRSLPCPPQDLVWKHLRYKRIIRRIVRRKGPRVQGGPFSGMIYGASILKAQTCGWLGGSMVVPKLVGCYEAELHPIVNWIIERGYHRIIDIGCAEGYYAVGLALRLPSAMIYALDINPLARDRCKEMARLNGVADRVVVADCDLSEVRRLTSEPALVICDCEGHELDLLRPEEAPGLICCDMLVELHDPCARRFPETISPWLQEWILIDRRVSEIIQHRFADTHRADLIPSADRDPAAYPVLRYLSPCDAQLAIAELHPAAHQWAFLRSRISVRDGSSEPVEAVRGTA